MGALKGASAASAQTHRRKETLRDEVTQTASGIAPALQNR